MPSTAAITNLLANWPRDAATAITMQQALRGQVRLANDAAPSHWIAGLDVGYDPATNTSHAVGVLMTIDRLQPFQLTRAVLPTEFPYIPGFLSFREVPVLLAVLRQFERLPDLLMVDGQGIAHPRRFGIASHVGVLTDIPAIGVAKSKLCGRFDPLPEAAGCTTPLRDGTEQIGTVLRSKAKCLPLFVSPGHRIDHAAALHVTKQCLRGFRLPEPTRIADKYSKKVERERQPALL